MTNEMEIKIHRDIDEINEDEWNHLARNSSAFYDYGWFKTFYHLLGKPFFVAAYRRDVLIGLLPGFIVSEPKTYLFHNPKDALFCRNEIDLAEFARRMRKYKSWIGLKTFSYGSKFLEPFLNYFFFPAYVVISPRGFVGDFLFEDEVIARRILDVLESICINEKIKTKCIMWVEEENVRLTTALDQSGYAKFHGELYFKLETKWCSTEEMMDSMISERRRNLKKNFAKLNVEDIKLEFHNGTNFILEHIEEIAVLFKKHAVICGDLLGAFDVKNMLSEFCNNLKERIYITLARNRQTIVGFCVGLNKNGKLYPKFVGYEPTVSKKLSLHYNLVYYNHMMKNLETGGQEINFGAGDPETKLVRGCLPGKLMCYYSFGNRTVANSIIQKYMSFMNDYKTRLYSNVIKHKTWKV